jgi:hypothetical protein
MDLLLFFWRILWKGTVALILLLGFLLALYLFVSSIYAFIWGGLGLALSYFVVSILIMVILSYAKSKIFSRDKQ